MFISAYKKRQCNETITILDAAGAEVVLASTDQIRLKIGRAGETPVEVSVVDDSDSDAIKHANKGSFILHNTQLGSVSLN